MRTPTFIAMLLTTACLQAETLPDPTKPFGFDAEPEIIVQEQNVRQENIFWRLSGIRIADKTRSAILNGQVVNVGDTIDGAKVVDIQPAWIVIVHEKQRIRLQLLDINIKRDKQAVAQNKETEPK